jgi:FKBP-type peptidyl-prolyl cis-trans isomerase FkpA
MKKNFLNNSLMFEPYLLMKHSAVILFFSLFLSCNNNSNTSPSQKDLMAPPSDSMKEALLKSNRHDMVDEASEIDAFAARRSWEMNITGTGLRYMIYKQGEGKVHPKKGDFVTIAYKTFLLDGTLCYTVDKSKPEIFEIGKANVTRGLEEGIINMKEGDKARLLVPKHLAYGLLGDDKKIPANSILFYDVELLSVK